MDLYKLTLWLQKICIDYRIDYSITVKLGLSWAYAV